jgi:NADH-quinone oxidoreductase subunit G
MPKLTIDGREIEVPKGTKVIEAAERLGIVIPRFCYHPGLGSFGACRMCAVKFVEGPVKGIEMSCMEEARDGMVVSTTDPEVMEFRRYVIEWLMMNHPHDCPVCDEGGHCLLQDETVSGGHGIRRYQGKKRTYEDQDLGPFVQHEMNRCIHCWRCRNFYQGFAGYRDFGALQIAHRMYFGRFSDGPLESPFSGNLIDICPTGVLTDKPSRYRGRRWDYERSPSLCIHCSLGCSIVGSARYREVIRLEARLNEKVNGYFICDRGRYGFNYESLPSRPRQPRVGEGLFPWHSAIEEAAEALVRIHKTSGPQAVACLGSPRCSLETLGQVVRLCRHYGWREPGFFLDSSAANKTRRAVSRLDSRLAVSMREAEAADFVLAVAADPVNEAPMLALAMRQAFRKGARVVVIDPRPISLPLAFDSLPVPARDVRLCLSVLLRHALSEEDLKGAAPEAIAFHQALPSRYSADLSMQERLVRLGEELGRSRKPLILCGTDVALETTPDFAADCASLLRAANREAHLLYSLPGPNAFGAALLSHSGGSFAEILAGIEKGEIKALLIVEADPFNGFPDRQRLTESLKKLDLLIALDYLPTLSAERAHILLPTATLFETDSHWVNHEGRLQKASVVHRGGIPIHQVRGGSHPPRVFENSIPGGEIKPAADALFDLGVALSLHENAPYEADIWSWLIKENPIFRGLPSLGTEDPGIRVIPDVAADGRFSGQGKEVLPRAPQQEEGLDLLLVDWTFGTEELSGFSPYAQRAERQPHVMMHREEASRLGLSDGDKVTLHLPGGHLEVEVKTAGNMSSTVIMMPRHRRLAWQKAQGFNLRLPTSKIERT